MKLVHQICFQILSISVMMLLFTLPTSYAQVGDTPDACAGTSCSCGGSIIAGSCSTGWCCKPNVATCECQFYSTRCSCGPAMGGSVSIPVIYEQNIRDFASLLKSAAFKSSESKSIAEKLPILITAARTNNSQLYFGTSEELENLTRRLPANEKQSANTWIASKGGTLFIE